MVDSHGVLLLKEYQLCRHCLARQSGTSKRQAEKCYICRGMMGSLDDMAKEVLAATKPYEFETFLVGATLPTQMYEREDALRARLKIRGRESIKSQLTRELGLRLSRLTGKKVDYARPDIAINVTVDRDGAAEVAVRARPLAVEGHYTKKERGLPQKQERCPMCLGKGCNLCDNSGLAGFASIEGIIAKHLMSAAKGQSPKFSWVGSEDQNSLVLGRGRPFYAKVSDPKIRRPKIKFSEAGVAAKITAIMDDVPDTQSRFTTKTRISARCGRDVDANDMKLLRSLAGAEVRFENRSKMAIKKICSAQAKKTAGREFLLTIHADGGLPIKQFVGGEEYIEPNVSKLLGAKCECVSFDVLAVDLQ